MEIFANSKFVKESTFIPAKRNQKYAASWKTRSQESGPLSLFASFSRVFEPFESFNKFTEFDENFKILRALTELRLNNNQISTCPKNFGELKSLRLVDLSHNEIGELPSEQLDTIRLIRVSLAYYQMILALCIFWKLQITKSLSFPKIFNICGFKKSTFLKTKLRSSPLLFAM